MHPRKRPPHVLYIFEICSSCWLLLSYTYTRTYVPTAWYVYDLRPFVVLMWSRESGPHVRSNTTTNGVRNSAHFQHTHSQLCASIYIHGNTDTHLACNIQMQTLNRTHTHSHKRFKSEKPKAKRCTHLDVYARVLYISESVYNIHMDAYVCFLYRTCTYNMYAL